jgi:hypothetical protein
METKSEVEVNGQYSEDLDLFYKPEDAANLFNVETGSFVSLCELTLQMLSVKNSDQAKYNELQE